jgi:protoporphyrinogen oxidase
MSKRVVVLGGGLAGLACAYELARRDVQVTVLEREDHPGGMASSFVDNRAAEYWSYDFGPHRFHTHDEELIEHVKHILAGNHRPARRLSRIVLFNRFFDYPLKAGNVLRNLPPHVLIRAFLDYACVRFTERTGLSHHSDDNFEGWVTKRFGRTLYELFFGRYTQKAWKMPPNEISGDWASQRISLLSLGDTVKKTLFRPLKGNKPRTLVTDFVYPELGGIGEIAHGYVREIEAMGGNVVTGAPITRLHRDGVRVTGVQYGGSQPGTLSGDYYISTIPITVLARSARPAAPEQVLAAIANLRYVSIIFVYLKLNRSQVSPDNWLYLPEPHLTVHRISEFKNFSPGCAPPDKTMVCAEITCRIGDEHWRAKDQDLIATAVSDLEQLDLIQPDEVLEGFVKKIPFAYPVYDLEYKENLAPIVEFVHSLENIQTGGRQGLFRYNNMDQSIEMGRKMAWGLLETAETGRDVAATDHEAVATAQEYFG